MKKSDLIIIYQIIDIFILTKFDYVFICFNKYLYYWSKPNCTLKVASDTSATSNCWAGMPQCFPSWCFKVIYLSSWFNWRPYLTGLEPSKRMTETKKNLH